MSRYAEPMKVVCEIDQIEVIDLKNLLEIARKGSPFEVTGVTGKVIGYNFRRDTDSDRYCAILEKILSHIHIV